MAQCVAKAALFNITNINTIGQAQGENAFFLLSYSSKDGTEKMKGKY